MKKIFLEDWDWESIERRQKETMKIIQKYDDDWFDERISNTSDEEMKEKWIKIKELTRLKNSANL